jgi:pyruvate-formate lyase
MVKAMQKAESLYTKDYRLTFYERIQYLLESERLFEDQPYPLRYGRTLHYILSRISVPIAAGELLVGAVKEIVPSDGQISLVNDLSRQWWDVPDEEIQRKILWFYSNNWLRRRPPWFHSFGHLGLEWSRILQIGLGGYLAEARARLEREDVRQEPAKRAFLEGALLCYEALSAYIRRYARAAGEAACGCADEAQRRDLEAAAARCAYLSEAPPRGLHEALQLLWLITLPLMKVCGCGVFDFGRMDQYLLPYYRHDMQSGTLTRERALELLSEFFLKNNQIMSPADHMSIEDRRTDFTLEVTFDDPNYLIVGGRLAGGEPGVNELSHLVIEAQAALRLRNPFVVVRYYSGIDEEFWLKTCAAMRDNATIIVYNDNTMIPALVSYGIPPADAADYGLYGCNDPDLTGKQGGLRQLWFNLLLPLELVLNRNLQRADGVPAAGQSQFSLRERMIGLMTGRYRGTATKPLERISSIDELLAEYRKQVRFLLADYRAALDADLALEKKYNRGRIRIEDCFLSGPVERALTWNDGGSLYNILTVQGCGIASVADSLAAIRKLVFEDRELGLAELADILCKDYEGAEELQRRLRYRLPKFGNDIPAVDELAAEVVNIFCDEVAMQNKGEHLYRFLPTLSTDRDFTAMGRIVGATADGRRAGDPLSENQSPTEGADAEGLTALLNSVSRLPFHRITGGPLNLRIHPSAVAGTEGAAILGALLRTYFEKGGMQVQINVVSRAQLLDAQQNPDRFRGLCVRVVGYSAYFVQMGRRGQDELIKRTEHS